MSDRRDDITLYRGTLYGEGVERPVPMPFTDYSVCPKCPAPVIVMRTVEIMDKHPEYQTHPPAQGLHVMRDGSAHRVIDGVVVEMPPLVKRPGYPPHAGNINSEMERIKRLMHN